MNKTIRLIYSAALAAGAVLIPGESRAAETLQIKVKSARLRAAPQHWASGAGDLKLGDSVSPLESQNAWFKVRTAGGKVGYVHESALTDKKVVLKASGANIQGGSADDVVLAGKGFNKEVERQFAAQNPTASFAEVNRMESIKIKESEIINFMKTGGLKSNA